MALFSFGSGSKLIRYGTYTKNSTGTVPYLGTVVSTQYQYTTYRIYMDKKVGTVVGRHRYLRNKHSFLPVPHLSYF